MSEIDWMMPGVVAVYNSKTHPQCGKKCIIESVPFMRHCGNLVVQTTLFDTPEFACHFIPEHAEVLTLPVGMLESLKRDSGELTKVRAVLSENKEAVDQIYAYQTSELRAFDEEDTELICDFAYSLIKALEAE